MSWEFALRYLPIDYGATKKAPFPFHSWREVREYGEMVHHAGCARVGDLAVDLGLDPLTNPSDTIPVILRYFPVLALSRGSTCVLLDYHGYECYMEALVSLPADAGSASAPAEDASNPSMETKQRGGRRENSGATPYHARFPTLVSSAEDFIKARSPGYKAQDRRRTETATVIGCTVFELHQYLLQKVPGLKGTTFCENSAARLMMCPRANTRNSQNFFGLVNARVGRKKNNARHPHQDAHFCAAGVMQVLEFVHKFEEDCGLFG